MHISHSLPQNIYVAPRKYKVHPCSLRILDRSFYISVQCTALVIEITSVVIAGIMSY